VPAALEPGGEKIVHDLEYIVPLGLPTGEGENLWARLNLEASGLRQRAARMPSTLLAAMHMPIPEPQTRIPRSASPRDTISAALKAKSG
jgi:hypothetical protein